MAVRTEQKGNIKQALCKIRPQQHNVIARKPTNFKEVQSPKSPREVPIMVTSQWEVNE